MIKTNPNQKINTIMDPTAQGRPILFQVVDPANQPIFQYLLAMHINPSKLSENMTKSKTVVQTYGGYVEWIWPDELSELSADVATGAFLGPINGLTASNGSSGDSSNSPMSANQGRHGTIAWERQEDLLDLFRNNGVIFDGTGAPVLRGHVMCIYDRGIYVGYFDSFSVKEDDQHSFSFDLSFGFKVETTLYRFPGRGMLPA